MVEALTRGILYSAPMADWITGLAAEVVACRRCPRLISHCRKMATLRKREFAEWEYWGRPVPGWGDPKARLWVLGLAPAAHGANRTGRMFTGDSSGRWLYRELHRFGFASQPHAESRDDGLRLIDAYISSAGRCAPPDNKPTPAELGKCAPYLDRELERLDRLKVILTTGSIAFGACLRMLARRGAEVGRLAFSHGAEFRIGGLTVVATYHPSRQNTNTGRLTPEMWTKVFARARKILGD